jgi:hypothetical protein
LEAFVAGLAAGFATTFFVGIAFLDLGAGILSFLFYDPFYLDSTNYTKKRLREQARKAAACILEYSMA